jgi:transcriptional regulator with XRE-family HTH domain
MDGWEEFKQRMHAERPDVAAEYERLEPLYRLIGDVLELQHLRGLTYEQLAEKMGRKRAVITRFEMGNSNPSLSFMQELAQALDAKLTVRLAPSESASAERPAKRPSGKSGKARFSLP